MAQVNLHISPENVSAVNTLPDGHTQAITGYLAIRVPEHAVETWNFEVGDEHEVVFVVTQVVM